MLSRPEGSNAHSFLLQRTKPKGLIDLSCAYLYPVHDSVFDKPYSFQLVERALPCLATVTYLSANYEDDVQVITLITYYISYKLFCTFCTNNR